MSYSGMSIGAYKRVDVETASQGKLVVMLFNGAIQRAEEAKRLIASGNVQGIHDNLIRAQEIITELRGALNMEMGEIAANLDRVYEYILHLLVKANISKNTEPLDESIEHMTEIRNAWKEVFDKAAREEKQRAPQVNQHGASFMNLQG